MTKITPSALAVAIICAATPALAAVGIIEGALLTAGQAMAAMIASALAGWALAQTIGRLDARAKIAEAKAEADRTMLDRLAINADGAVDRNLNLAQLETFLRSFVLANLDVVLSPMLTQAQKADRLLDGAVKAFPQRNPELAEILPITPEVMRDKLAGAIGGVLTGTGDKLADALRQAGLVGVAPQKV